MKHFVLYIKYISLLIFSGLIIPFYNSAALHSKKAEKHIAQNTRSIPCKQALAPFSFFNDVVVTFFPALKD
jgi:hypothetical protein